MRPATLARPLAPLLVTLAFGLAVPRVVAAEVSRHAGHWQVVNGLVVLQLDADGTMTLRNTGEKGKLTLAADDAFTWEAGGKQHQGRFADGKLFLKNSQEGAPKTMEFLEFRRVEKDAAAEAIEFALRQQTQVVNAFANVRRTSQERAILNNLRQLAAAADQYFLEHGVNTVRLADIVGPDKYVRYLRPVDGEDYAKLDLNQGSGPWKITTPGGLTVEYDRGGYLPPGVPPRTPPASAAPRAPATPDEKRRLEAVAAEVARRRQIREDAARQLGVPLPEPGAELDKPAPVPATPPAK